MIKYTINSKNIKIKTHKFEGKQSIEFYESQIYKTLNKIGITKEYIEINLDKHGIEVQVKWKINNNYYEFRCSSQETIVLNLGAIAQAIQEDIRQITRGIKDLFLVMTQYESKKIKNKKLNLLAFKTNASEENFKIDELLISKEIKENLSKDYFYLQNYDNIKLDNLYFKLKEQCIKQNKINHPMLKALKIIRQKRNLSL